MRNYHFVLTISPVDGVNVLDRLPDCFSPQHAPSQDGVMMLIEGFHEQSKPWLHHYAEVPELADHVCTLENLPAYLEMGCEDSSFAYVKAVVQKRGSMFVEWAKEHPSSGIVG